MGCSLVSNTKVHYLVLSNCHLADRESLFFSRRMTGGFPNWIWMNHRTRCLGKIDGMIITRDLMLERALESSIYFSPGKNQSKTEN